MKILEKIENWFNTSNIGTIVVFIAFSITFLLVGSLPIKRKLALLFH